MGVWLAAPPSGGQEPAPAAVRETAPQIYYVEDDAGRLVPVPGFSYRDFSELFRLKEGLPGPVQPPAAVLESVVVRVEPADGAADGTRPATVECSVRQARRGWVSVPLDLAGLIVTAAPEHEGPGRLLVDAAAGGLQAWFDAAPDAEQSVRHRLTIRGRIPVEETAAAETLSMRMPPAISSRIEVRVQRSDPEVAILPALPTARISSAAADGGGIVTVAGVAGAVTIRIGARSIPAGVLPSVVVESVVRVDGRNAVIEAVLRLEGLPATSDRVRIALPPRTSLRGVRGPAAVVAQGDADAPAVDVAIARDPGGKATVTLECERPIDPSGATSFDAAGFMVDGIEPWRQWGRMSLVVEGEWQAEWNDSPRLRRVDPPPTARQPGFVAAFAYDAQPASLPIRVRARRSRLVIEPEYRFDVGATRIDFRARLRVAASGAPVPAIVVDVDPSWTIDDVGPSGVVDAPALGTEAGRLTIPFAQPLAGDAVVEIRGSRTVDRGEERIAWSLPTPRAELVGPATVAIFAESDIELVPDNDAIRGLVRQTAAATAPGTAERLALAYRLDAVEGTFVATRRFLPRRVDASLVTRVDVDDARTTVEQTIRLDVAHVPLEFVELLVPADVWRSGTLEVRQGEVSLDPVEIPGTAAADGGDVVTRAILPLPVLGAGDLLVRYELATPAVPPAAAAVLDLPVVRPVVSRVGRHVVVVGSAESLAVDVRGDAWKRDTGGQSAAARTWSSSRPHATVPLAIAARQRVTAGAAVVEAAWLQTSFLPDRRQDVCLYAITGAAERVTLGVQLAAGDELEVRLDGVPLPDAPRSDGRVVVDLPRGGAGRWLLEVRHETRDSDWDRLRARVGVPRRVRLDPPAFAAEVSQRRFYWEIAAHADEHVCGAPVRWTSQQVWRWEGAGWRRESVVSQRALMEWVRSAASGPARPPVAAAEPVVDPPLVERRAVYSGLGAPGPATVWLLPSWFVVFAASAVSLLVGMAFVYRPGLARVAVVLPALAAAWLAAAAFPDEAPLVLQAALPGVVLAGVAWGLRRLLDRTTRSDARRIVSPSSLTRAAPSLIVAGSSIRQPDDVTMLSREMP